MAQTVKRKSPSGSKTFPIIISVVVVAMIAVVVFSVSSSKEEVKSQSKIEYATAPAVSAVSIDGKLGESKLPPYSQGGTDAAVGMIVPQIVTQDFSAKTVTIKPGEKPYVLVFVAHWCPHCQVEVPSLVKLHSDGSLPDDVEFIAVATGTSDQKPNYPPSKWLFNQKWPWQKVADDESGSIATAFGLDGYPFLVFVNADGTVASRTSGEQEDAVFVAGAKAISKEK